MPGIKAKAIHVGFVLAIAAITLSPVPDATSSESLSAADNSAQGGPLTPGQIDNLVLLGKVWGVAKYHHPDIAGGRIEWDAELGRILPVVLGARGNVAGTAAISRWLAALNTSKCQSCAAMPDSAHLR